LEYNAAIGVVIRLCSSESRTADIAKEMLDRLGKDKRHIARHRLE
jgi:hypothetical protein